MTRPAIRNKLEVEFCKNIDTVIDRLLIDDFPKEDVESFIKTVKVFLKYQDLKGYIVDALHDKAVYIAKLHLAVDKGLGYSYRKFLATLISLDDPEVMEMIETNFLKEKTIDNFLILIEEKLKQQKDISNCENLFVSLLPYSYMDLETLNKFLTTTKKDSIFLVEKLLENKSYPALRKYIDEVAAQEPTKLKTLVPILIAKYDKSDSNYLELIRTIINHDVSFINALLFPLPFDLRASFEKYILTSSVGNHVLIKNYSNFLLVSNQDWFDSFEREYLNSALSSDIVKYSINVPFSSKRLILRRLVELKIESSLVEFIKIFPEFRNLLPML